MVDPTHFKDKNAQSDGTYLQSGNKVHWKVVPQNGSVCYLSPQVPF